MSVEADLMTHEKLFEKLLASSLPEGWDKQPNAAQVRRMHEQWTKKFLTAVRNSGCAVVSRQPTDELLRSMALRHNHGVFAPCCDLLDQPPPGFTQEEWRARRIEVALSDARTQHEEVVGTGFYRNADLTKETRPDNPFHTDKVEHVGLSVPVLFMGTK